MLRFPLRAVPLALALVLAPGLEAQVSPLMALEMMGEATGLHRHRLRRRNQREKAKEREEVRVVLATFMDGNPKEVSQAAPLLVRYAERAKRGAMELEDPKALAVAFLGKLEHPDWKVRWESCRGLVALGYTPTQIQGWMAGTVRLPAPRL